MLYIFLLRTGSRFKMRVFFPVVDIAFNWWAPVVSSVNYWWSEVWLSNCIACICVKNLCELVVATGVMV